MESLDEKPIETEYLQKPIVASAVLFALVGLGAVSLWALNLPFLRSEARLYPAIAILFIVGGAPSLLPAFQAANGPAGRVKFLLLFFPAFCVFSASWWFFWDLFLNHRGEIFGSAIGIFLMILVFRGGFNSKQSILTLFAKAFLFYTISYYIGEYLHEELRGLGTKQGVIFARLAWGLFIGIGLGAGLAIISGSLRVKS